MGEQQERVQRLRKLQAQDALARKREMAAFLNGEPKPKRKKTAGKRKRGPKSKPGRKRRLPEPTTDPLTEILRRGLRRERQV